MEEFPIYQKVRRMQGGIRKGIYTLLKQVNTELETIAGRLEDVEAGVMAEGSIGTDELAEGAVNNDKVAADAGIEKSKIAALHIGGSDMDIFESEEQTGTGEAQNIAHGLGDTPSIVWVDLTTVGVDGAAVSYTKGSTNVNVTATAGAKYIVHAIK